MVEDETPFLAGRGMVFLPFPKKRFLEAYREGEEE
jgi:hypothetical protein